MPKLSDVLDPTTVPFRCPTARTYRSDRFIRCAGGALEIFGLRRLFGGCGHLCLAMGGETSEGWTPPVCSGEPKTLLVSPLV
jgi:hypothetical protein